MFTPPSILMSKLILNKGVDYKILYFRVHIANAFVVLGEELLINMLI